MTAETHVNYPHNPGYLFGCPACEARCHCTPGNAECVYDGEHIHGDPAPAVTAFEAGRTAERELREAYGFATADYNSGAAFIWSRTAPELADVDWESWVAGWNTSVAERPAGGAE